MKGSYFKIILLLSVLIVLVSISGGMYAKAQEPGGEGGDVEGPASSLPPKVLGQGIQAASSLDGANGEGGDVEGPASSLPPRVLGASSPDDGATGLASAAASTKWYTTAGSTFMPHSNVVTWGYGGAGCLAPNTTGYWRASVNVPDGSVLKQLIFGYHNDAASTTSTVYLYKYGYQGTSTSIKSVTSTAGGVETGYHYVSATIADETVVYFDYSYVFSWSGSTTQELCYVQVSYIPPSVFAVALPTILR